MVPFVLRNNAFTRTNVVKLKVALCIYCSRRRQDIGDYLYIAARSSRAQSTFSFVKRDPMGESDEHCFFFLKSMFRG